VVDAPAAGHAITFLRSAAGLANSSTSGPVREQADAALALLSNATRCQVILVTLAEETPVNELIETAYSLEEDVGVKLGPIVAISCWPEIPGLADELARLRASRSNVAIARKEAAEFRLQRIASQRVELARLNKELPLPLVKLPFLFTADLGIDDLGALSDAFLGQLETLGLSPENEKSS